MPEEERKVKPEHILAGVAGAFGLGMLGYGIYALTRPKVLPPEEPTPGLANLYGIVSDASTGKPIVGVEIVLNGGVPTYTGSAGYYSFIDIEPRTYTISFAKDGYEVLTEEIVLEPGNNELNVELVLLEVIPPEEEPPLPPLGTGMPTDEEIEAVKATVRFRLEHLPWDICNLDIHYTAEMDAITAEALQPIFDLQERIVQEGERRRGICLDESQGAFADVQSEMDELARVSGLILGFDWRKHCCAVGSGGQCHQMAIYPGTGMMVCYDTGVKVYDFLSSEAREAYNAGGCYWDCCGPGRTNGFRCPGFEAQYRTLITKKALIIEACDKIMWGYNSKANELNAQYWYCGR
ncbi:hypothetical protein ES703_30691 [subsurface metagenome]